MTPSELANVIRTAAKKDFLLLDLRVAPQYAQARIIEALNLCIPTTLLKRPSFNTAKLTDTFKVEREKARFSAWRDCKYIIAYDAQSGEKKDATSAVHTLRKFEIEGFQGRSFILKGGFRLFSAQFPDLVDGSPLGGAPASKNLSLGSLAGAAVIGGCELPAAKSAANPFFSNIRQNMDLVGGVGQIDVKRPEGIDGDLDDILPAWLKKATAPPDHGRLVSEKFLRIEQAELSRMQKALSSRVSYGTPAVGSEKDVQIAGFEKGGKNRYNNIWPFEHARVRLQGRPEGACDYVNASHIKAKWSNKQYIASQGPLPATFEVCIIPSSISLYTTNNMAGLLECYVGSRRQSYCNVNRRIRRRPAKMPSVLGRPRLRAIQDPSTIREEGIVRPGQTPSVVRTA
jgi:protein-tyrosine phosphatase